MQCLKCQKDVFARELITIRYKAGTEDALFEIHACKKCYLTQWHYQYNASDKRDLKKNKCNTVYKGTPLKDFSCGECHSKQAIIKIITPSLSSRVLREIEWEGEILSRICLDCGLTELYELTLAGAYAQALEIEKRGELAKSFSCPICANNAVSQTGILSFQGWQSPSRRYYLFGTCKQCKHMMVFAEYL